MYGYVPSITNISSNNNFTGPDEEQILSDFAGFMGFYSGIWWNFDFFKGNFEGEFGI